MKVEVNKKELTKFRKFLKTMYPKEGCGFLIGVELVRFTIVDKIYIPTDQVPFATKASIDVQDEWWDEAEDLAKESNLTVVGFIHSHPEYQDTSMSEMDLAMTDYVKIQLNEVENPIMGVVGIYKAKNRMMTRVGLWPMFNQHKICLK